MVLEHIFSHGILIAAIMGLLILNEVVIAYAPPLPENPPAWVPQFLKFLSLIESLLLRLIGLILVLFITLVVFSLAARSLQRLWFPPHRGS